MSGFSYLAGMEATVKLDLAQFIDSITCQTHKTSMESFLCGFMLPLQRSNFQRIPGINNSNDYNCTELIVG